MTWPLLSPPFFPLPLQIALHFSYTAFLPPKVPGSPTLCPSCLAHILPHPSHARIIPGQHTKTEPGGTISCYKSSLTLLVPFISPSGPLAVTALCRCLFTCLPLSIECRRGFPGGAAVESLPADAGDTGSSPGLGGSHMSRSNWAREPQLLSLRVWSLCSATGEAAKVRGPRTVMKSGPRLSQLEKALARKRRPNTVKKNR